MRPCAAVFLLRVVACVMAVCARAAVETAQAQDDYAAMLQESARKFDAAVDAWHAAKDPAEKLRLWKQARELADGVRVEAGGNGNQAQEPLIEEVALGGSKANYEIKPPAEATRVPLTILKTFTEIPDATADNGRDWLGRRINDDALEVWTSREGWLFDGRGKLLNHAVVPRRDGTGLQWFGAFHPDGSWITTDLWSYDKALYLFSRDGQYEKEAASGDMYASGGSGGSAGLIGWARSDRDGKGWVLYVPTEFKQAWLNADLQWRVLAEGEAWLLCQPRALGARYGKVVSDDGKLELSGGTAGHGPSVGHFGYTVTPFDRPASDWNLLPLLSTSSGWSHAFWWNGTGQLGFWPRSHKVYVVIHPSGDETGSSYETWFFAENGDCQGWTNGVQFGDAADGRSMLFRNGAYAVYTVDPGLHVGAVRKFVDAGDTVLKPQMMFDDLKLGLFLRDQQLMLASWK